VRGLRAERSGLADAPVQPPRKPRVVGIVSTCRRRLDVPRLIVIDSIQTMWTANRGITHGHVTQVAPRRMR